MVIPRSQSRTRADKNTEAPPLPTKATIKQQQEHQHTHKPEMYPFTNPRVRFNMQPESAPSPRRGRRAARSRATPQNNDEPTDAQSAANSPQVPDLFNGLFGGEQPRPGLPGLSNATATSSSQAPGILNGLFAGDLTQPSSPLPERSNATAANNRPLHPAFDGSDNVVLNAFGTNTTNLAGGALTPALVPFGSGLRMTPSDVHHDATMEELEQDMLRYPGTSREWLNDRAMYFSDEVRKARKAGRREPAKDLVISAQELEDPNDRYSGSVYIDDPDMLEAGRRGQTKGFVDPYLRSPQQEQENPGPRSTGVFHSDDLVDLAFNRPQRRRQTRRSGTENREDARENFVNPYLSILEPGEQVPDTSALHSAPAVDGPQRGREIRRSTKIPPPEITQDDDYEYVRRSHRPRRQRSPSPSPSTSSSSTTSSLSISSSNSRYEEALQTLNTVRRTFGEQLCVPLTRLTKNDLKSFDPESILGVFRLAMSSSWAKYLCFGTNFMRTTGFMPPGFNFNAGSVRVFEELMEARNLTTSERVDLEMAVEDLKEMSGEQ